MKISGAIFDVDGTLLDSLYVWATIAEDYLRSRGREPREDMTARFRSLSLPQAAAFYQTDYGLTDSAADIMAGINAMIAQAYREDVRAKPGAAAFLEQLRRQGVPMCVATATNLDLVGLALARLGLTDYFRCLRGCTELCLNKDDPAFFRHVHAELGTAAETTWVFEDSPHAAKSAKAAGLKVALIADPAQGDCSALQGQCCDIYVQDFAELSRYFAEEA